MYCINLKPEMPNPCTYCMLGELTLVRTAKQFQRNPMWLLRFPYFSKHNWANHFEDEVKGLPVQDKCNILKKKTLS